MKRESNLKYNILEIKLPDNVADTLRQVIGFLQLFFLNTDFSAFKIDTIVAAQTKKQAQNQQTNRQGRPAFLRPCTKRENAFTISGKAKVGKLRLKLLQMFSARSIKCNGCVE